MEIKDEKAIDISMVSKHKSMEMGEEEGDLKAVRKTRRRLRRTCENMEIREE